MLLEHHVKVAICFVNLSTLASSKVPSGSSNCDPFLRITLPKGAHAKCIIYDVHSISRLKSTSVFLYCKYKIVKHTY